MKNFHKLLAITAAGLLLTSFSVQAILPENIEARPRPAGIERVSPQVRIDQEMQDFSEYIGISKQDLMQYYNEGWSIRDIHQGAFLSYASQKSLIEIMQLREQMPWRRVIYTLKLTPNDLMSAQNELEANYLAEKLDVNKTVITFLVDRMYTPDEIIHGVIYAEYVSDKSPADIIELHNPPTMDWQRLANQMGITDIQLQEINQRIENMNLHLIHTPHMRNICPMFE